MSADAWETKAVVREVALRIRAITYEGGEGRYVLESQGDPLPHEVIGMASYIELTGRRAMIAQQDEAKSLLDTGGEKS